MNNNSQKFVCSDCAGNNEITKDIFDEEKINETCSYCNEERNCIDLVSLAKAIDCTYRENYEQCKNGHSPIEIISEMLELDKSAGVLDVDIVSMLSNQELGSEYKDTESMYDEDMTYSSFSEKYPPINDGRVHKELWDSFCHSIQHRTRFFNIQIIDWLNRIFLGLDKVSYEDGISPIRTIHPNDSDAIFYRARYSTNAQERIKICCNPTQELSSPPVHLASNGRMNPTGISVFYAAFERETCIAEIRIPVGESAISGQFELKEPITVFDLTVFDKIDPEKIISDSFISNIGDNNVDSYEDRLSFLQKFCAEICKPYPPSKESLEYMPTQAFVEYLAHHYEPKIDAVIYPSTQRNGNGKNIVFLNRAAKVLCGGMTIIKFHLVAKQIGLNWNQNGMNTKILLSKNITN
jgi:RES domain